MAVKIIKLVLVFAFCIPYVSSQTYCSLRFPARDTTTCDATGSLEENVNADVFETKGNIDVMQDYQQETFSIFDQQFTGIMENEQMTKGNVADLEEEVLSLKQIMADITNGLVDTTSVPQARSKRAAGSATGSSNPAQLALDSAKQTFQHNVSDILLQLQNISKTLDDEAKKSAVEHATMLQEVSSNRQDLSAVDRQIQALDNSIRKLSIPKATGPNGVSLTSVTQEVTQLKIDAAVYETIEQRQIDNDEKLVKQMEAAVQKTSTDIQAVNATLAQAEQDLNNQTNQVSTLQGAEGFYENKVNTFITTSIGQLSNLTQAFNAANAGLSQLGQNILKTTIDQNTLTRDMKSYRQSVDGIQSVVTFTKKPQQQQLGELLKIKLDFIDNVNVLKFAFGMITKVP